MYSASSSLRAWTLRLPSVVLRMRLRSLKLRLAFVARALTMPRRMRSWIRRSSSGSAGAGAGMRSRAGGAARVGLRRCASALATVPPGDEKSKDDVQATESRGQEIVGPGCGCDDSECARGHETKSHDGDNGDGIRAAGNDASAVEKQPSGREGGFEAGTLEQKS